MYRLTVGTTGPGSSNICSWGPSTATSAPVCGINLNGENFYARLSSLINGVWFSTDYTYATEQAAFLNSPTPGTQLSGSAVDFSWWPGELIGPSAFRLIIGDNGIGSTLYSKVNGIWLHTNYTYKAQ